MSEFITGPGSDPDAPASPAHKSAKRLSASMIVRLILLLAFIGVGTRALYEHNPGSLHDTGPDGWGTGFTPEASTDLYLRSLLRDFDRAAMAAIPHPAAHLQSVLARLPGDGPILFTGKSDDDRYLMVYLTLSQLSWPREVYDAGCGDHVPFAALPGDLRPAVVIYFSGLPPDAITEGQTILPGLSLVITREQKTWNSFCSPSR